jgi:hypothetical protein
MLQHDTTPPQALDCERSIEIARFIRKPSRLKGFNPTIRALRHIPELARARYVEGYVVGLSGEIYPHSWVEDNGAILDIASAPSRRWPLSYHAAHILTLDAATNMICAYGSPLNGCYSSGWALAKVAAEAAAFPYQSGERILDIRAVSSFLRLSGFPRQEIAAKLESMGYRTLSVPPVRPGDYPQVNDGNTPA